VLPHLSPDGAPNVLRHYYIQSVYTSGVWLSQWRLCTAHGRIACVADLCAHVACISQSAIDLARED
jgi:hypothetical protein